MEQTRQAVLDSKSEELLGYVSRTADSWSSETEFGYIYGRFETEHEARSNVRREGAKVLQGVWMYTDQSGEWHYCVLKDVYENRVVVNRTDELGMQQPESYEQVTILRPDETKLTKAT